MLKCSLAYLLGSLATLVPVIAGFLGKQDGKHIVATVTVYFHPARSAGSMHEATILASVAFLYATFISFTSMGVSIFFGQRNLLAVGHAIVLVVFCGGGLGLVGWTKQRMGHPTVNVACSLASLAIITTLTKEGSVQAATFSEDKVVQVLKMVILGIAATTFVNLAFRPVRARKELYKDFTEATDLLGDILVAITRAFISGLEQEIGLDQFQEVLKDHKQCMERMVKNLKEAKWEHLVIGGERQYKIEAKLVKCLQRLSQDIGGLRSAALTQFNLIRTSADKAEDSNVNDTISRRSSLLDYRALRPITEIPNDIVSLGRIDEEPESASADPAQPQSPEDMFTTFIMQLGPSMRSLAFTLKQILDELPFSDETKHTIAVNANFHTSLEQAISLFRSARKTALTDLYKSKEMHSTHSLERIADFEEIAASCGHFSFALLDFAEDTLSYLDILEELKQIIEHGTQTRSWGLSMSARNRRTSTDGRNGPLNRYLQENDQEPGLAPKAPKDVNAGEPATKHEKTAHTQSWTYAIWRALGFFRRDDIRFAIKVGLGAALFALPSFLRSTRPTFQHFRGEWGLVSYMVVCSMTIGASNTTGIERFIGTGLGAMFAIVAWIIADESPWLLGFFGWLVSLGCFYLIIGKGRGPMGRFILLTYNLGALYAYSLSVKDGEDDEDEGGINPEIWEIVYHRVAAVIAGCIWGIIITRLIWPISARMKLKDGLCVLWLRMGLIWKRDPLAMFLLGEPQSSYMDIREEAELQSFLQHLEGLRKQAVSEFQLRGPFPDKTIGRVLERTGRMLDNFHAMNMLISKDLKASPGEAEVLRWTRQERFALSTRISHLFSVLASTVKMEYPLNAVLPNIEHTRDRLLARIFEFRNESAGASLTTDEDYEMIYAYGMCCAIAITHS